jgi:nitrite reductase/ring-hydroxylating ferredoxin subunit
LKPNDEDWTAVLAVNELHPDTARRVAVGDTDVLLYRTDREILAVGNRCTHQGAPLHKGVLRATGAMKTVTCPAHGSTFLLTDGRVLRGPATVRLPRYDVRVNGDALEVRERRR